MIWELKQNWWQILAIRGASGLPVLVKCVALIFSEDKLRSEGEVVVLLVNRLGIVSLLSAVLGLRSTCCRNGDPGMASSEM